MQKNRKTKLEVELELFKRNMSNVCLPTSMLYGLWMEVGRNSKGRKHYLEGKCVASKNGRKIEKKNWRIFSRILQEFSLFTSSEAWVDNFLCNYPLQKYITFKLISKSVKNHKLLCHLEEHFKYLIHNRKDILRKKVIDKISNILLPLKYQQ